MGKTSVQFVGNTFRLSSLGIAIAFLYNGYVVEGLAWSIVLGEILGTIAATVWIQFTCIRRAWVTLVALIGTLGIAFVFRTIQISMEDLSNLQRILILGGVYAGLGIPIGLWFWKRIKAT